VSGKEKAKSYAKRAVSSNDEKILQKVLKQREKEYESDNKFKNSPYKWLKNCPSGRKGKIAEDLILEWCAVKKLRSERGDKKNYDLLIENKRVEVKLSFLWETGVFKFQQIRNKQNYQYCLCLGVSPDEISAWLIPKNELRRNRPGLKPQHGGKKGVDTKWLSFRPEDPPKWIDKYGDGLSAVQRLRKKR